MTDLENELDCIDARIYSGPLLYIEDERAMLKDYLERWLNKINEHEEEEKRNGK